MYTEVCVLGDRKGRGCFVFGTITPQRAEVAPQKSIREGGGANGMLFWSLHTLASVFLCGGEGGVNIKKILFSSGTLHGDLIFDLPQTQRRES